VSSEDAGSKDVDIETENEGTPSPSALPLPVGPLSLFRSDFWNDPALQEYADDLSCKHQILSGLFVKAQSGQRLERDEEITMCATMRESNDMWRRSNLRLRYSEDFQAQEFYKFTEASLLKEGLSMDLVEALLTWEPDYMQAMIEKRPPPAMPAGLTPDTLSTIRAKLPEMMQRMNAPADLNAVPFVKDSTALDNELVREEYEGLMRDQEQLTRFGGSYRGFDPRGKEAFLDQVAKIEERWGVLLTRLQLMGQLNADYISQTQAYLQQIGLSVPEYKIMLNEAHSLMRQDAIKEGLAR